MIRAHSAINFDVENEAYEDVQKELIKLQCDSLVKKYLVMLEMPSSFYLLNCTSIYQNDLTFWHRSFTFKF